MENRERHEPRERGGDGQDWDERERERRRSGRFGRREFSQEENEGRWWQHQEYGPPSAGYYGSQGYRGPSQYDSRGSGSGRGQGEEFSPYGQGSQLWGGHGPQGYGQFGQHTGWGASQVGYGQPGQHGGMYGQGSQLGQPSGWSYPGSYGQFGSGMYGPGSQLGQPSGWSHPGSQMGGRMSQPGGIGQQSWGSSAGWGSQGRFGQPGPYSGKGPQNYKRSDERIREEVSERLTDHGLVDASAIEISVTNGEVTLKGTVPNRHMKRMSEDEIENVSGVKEVNNQLRVQQQSEGFGEEYEMAGRTDRPGSKSLKST